MNHDAIVSSGQLPWLPKDAADLDALHVHDIPVIGTFELHGSLVLFACLTGALDRTSIWSYVELSADAATELETAEFAGTAELEEWAHQQFVGQKAAFALAKDGKVTEWGPETVDKGGVLAACIRFIESHSHATRSQLRQAEQARADATRRVLEPVLEPA